MFRGSWGEVRNYQMTAPWTLKHQHKTHNAAQPCPDAVRVTGRN